MANPNLLDQAVRRAIIDQINGHENISRKMSEQRKFDIYRKRQAQYVLERLTDEFDPSTVRNMRKVLSINPCKRIVDEQASLYVSEPDRQFEGATDAEKEQIKELYKYGKVDPTMRLGNRYYKLHGQSNLYIRPMDGYVCTRALTPKDYDVIPDDENPEQAFAYILNVLDVRMNRTAPQESTLANPSDQRYQPGSDGQNQLIGDRDDSKRSGERYVWWTAEFHFTTDGHGDIVSSPGVMADGKPDLTNPIGMLPFVDIAHEKDFEFFVQIGSDVAEFVIDFLTQLSDLANTCRMQNYSQAVILSPQEPRPVQVGPNKILWLKQDPNSAVQPSFQFQSPQPDIMGSLEFLNVQLKMFLSSVGLNPGTVSGKNEMEKFTSGVDHLLANLDKFKASKEDMDLFRQAECELWKIMVAWQNTLYDVTDENGLDDKLKAIKLNPELDPTIVYIEPHAVQTDTEVEDYCVTAIDNKLMTRKEGIKRMYKVDDKRADEILAEIDKEAEANLAKAQDMMAKGFGPDGNPLPKPPTPNPNDPNITDNQNPPNDPNAINPADKTA